MWLPKLKKISTTRQMIDSFGGYNRNLRIGDSEFYDMKNMTSDHYPVLSPRGKRGKYTETENCTGMIAKDALCYTDGSNFVINGHKINLGLSDEPKQLISMGAYVIIMPDKKYINTADLDDFGDIEARYQSADAVTFSLCKLDGTLYENISATQPESPQDMQLWIDTSTTPNTLHQWSESSGMWVQVVTTYVKIQCTGIGKAFEQYDGVQISGLGSTIQNTNGDTINAQELAELEGSAVVWGKGDDYIIVVGILTNVWMIGSQITVSRTMPVMDYLTECNNRLWGCRYGPADNGEIVNEIYCSKLGDFKNWSCDMDIATDSWTGSVGTDGQWTGAATHMGYPLFFKENHMHKVYVSEIGAHQVVDTACRGVQKGCARSMQIVGETLYYKSASGVCAYDGALPVDIAAALGGVRYSDAVAGALGRKYYISMKDMDGQSHLFVYDTARMMWHKEDDLEAQAFCTCRGELLCLDTCKRIITMTGSGEAMEPEVDWMVQTGMIGLALPDMKYVARFNLRMTLPEGSRADCFAEYDSSGQWEHLFSLKGSGTGSFTLPVRPVRCDHMRLRLEGYGEAKLYSITKTLEQGSDIR